MRLLALPLILYPCFAQTSGSRIEFVRIAPGEFQMGCGERETPNLPDGTFRKCPADAKPQHRVRITKPFEIGKYEVTQAQWEAVMGANPSYFKGPDRPVEQVTWDEVQAFVAKLNGMHDGYHYRLPTEAEWEYSARAGETSQIPESAPLSAIAWFGGRIDGHCPTLTECPNGRTQSVGMKQPNAWGLYDALGNVSEWVQDWYGADYFKTSPPDNPTGPSEGKYHVARGGSWYSDAGYLRMSNRYQTVQVLRRRDMGFRVAREAVISAALRHREDSTLSRNLDPSRQNPRDSSPSSR
jgi:formylglycine-generating enzyme required for sulfatase activity